MKSTLDADKGEAVLEGAVHQTPLQYRRVYRFLPEAVECELTVRTDKAIKLAALSECLPYPLAAAKPGGLAVSRLGADGQPATGTAAKALYFSNAGGQGHLVTFAEARSVDLGQDHSKDHYGGEHDWGRVLIALPTDWTPGQAFVLKYRLQTCAAAGVEAAVKGR